MTTKTMTEEEYTELCDDHCGICVMCGEIQYGGMEPDAEKYSCDACEENAVMGIEYALISGTVEITEQRDSKMKEKQLVGNGYSTVLLNSRKRT